MRIKYCFKCCFIVANTICALPSAAIITKSLNEIKNLSFFSSDSIDSIDSNYFETNGVRYIVYGDDESTSISDALLVSKDTDYSFYFNDHNDEDYFKCTMNAGDIITVYCNKPYDLVIYRIKNSSITPYYSSNYNGEKIVIDSNNTFCFKITGPNNYTGRYSFRISSYNQLSYVNDYSYVNLKFSNGEIYSSLLESFDDLSSLPTTGYKQGYIGNNNNIPFVNDYIGGQYLSSYGQSITNYPLDFINTGMNGIFNSNYVATGNVSDDDRRVFDYDTYLADAIPFMRSSFSSASNYIRNGTAFFVDNQYAISAAHMAYDPDPTRLLFPSSISLYTAKHPDNYDSCLLNCMELYIPYSFIYYRNHTPSMSELCNYYDWCILKLNTSNIPAGYSHSYLGIQYPYNNNLTYYNMGYPHYTYSESNNFIEYDDPQRIKYNILSGTSGDIYEDNYVLKTYMDITHGHSGGPCLYKDNNIGIAVGIVSGNHSDGTGNIFSPINKYSFEILSKYIGGEI